MDYTSGDYAMFEGGAAQARERLTVAVSQLRAAYALAPSSSNHRTQVQAGIMSQLTRVGTPTLAMLVTVAVDELSRCNGRHLVDVEESSVEDWADD